MDKRSNLSLAPAIIPNYSRYLIIIAKAEKRSDVATCRTSRDRARICEFSGNIHSCQERLLSQGFKDTAGKIVSMW